MTIQTLQFCALRRSENLVNIVEAATNVLMDLIITVGLVKTFLEVHTFALHLVQRYATKRVAKKKTVLQTRGCSSVLPFYFLLTLLLKSRTIFGGPSFKLVVLLF